MQINLCLWIVVFITAFPSLGLYSRPYDPPIGIPAPEFGIEETVQNVYGSPDYYTHYIDNTHPNATDVNNPNGSAERPRKTIPKNLTLAAGSVVVIKGGPYNMDFDNLWTCNGTAERPVFIRGASSSDRPQLLNAHLRVNGQYFIIENIEFYDDSYVKSLDTVRYFSLRYSEIHNPIGKLIYYGAAVMARGSDVVIYRNNIHHNVTDDPKKGGDCHGVRPGVGAKRVWVLENEIHHNSGDAIQACHQCEPRPQYIYIGRNVLHEDRENAVDLKFAADIVISQNVVYGYKNATTSDGSAMVLGSDGAPNRPWVIFNEIYDSDNGIRNEATDNAWIIGNKIYNIKGFAIALEKWSDDLYIIGNTIYNVDVAIDQLQRETFRIHVFDNIFANIRGEKRGAHLYVPSAKIASASEFGNNLFWQNGSAVVLDWGGRKSYRTTADLTAFPGGKNNLIADPLFKDAANNDFTLRPKSPAIDAGVGHNAYKRFYQIYGMDINVDFNGVRRPQGRNWDIGAFEYSDQKGAANDSLFDKKVVIYKTIGNASLKMVIFTPRNRKSGQLLPAIVFFSGGGWRTDDINQFLPHSKYFASRGMVAIRAEYRVQKKHGTTPFECVKDGKSAIRWVRRHARQLGIDPDRIVGSGGSAGGHVAAAAAILPGLNEAGEDTSVSAKPNALVLFNPVFDNGPDGYGYERVKDRYLEISPAHNINGSVPPMIVFFGTRDESLPNAYRLQKRMRSFGNRCDLFTYEGQAHGFFNYRDGKNEYYYKTVFEADRFLSSLGYIQGEPTIKYQ